MKTAAVEPHQANKRNGKEGRMSSLGRTSSHSSHSSQTSILPMASDPVFLARLSRTKSLLAYYYDHADGLTDRELDDLLGWHSEDPGEAVGKLRDRLKDEDGHAQVVAVSDSRPKKFGLTAEAKIKLRLQFDAYLQEKAQAAKLDAEAQAARAFKERQANELGDQIRGFTDFWIFLETEEGDSFRERLRRGDRSLPLDMAQLAKFDTYLAQEVLDHPEDAIKAAEMSLKNFDLQLKEEVYVRPFKLPGSCKVSVADLRAQHIGKLLFSDCEINMLTDVRPQATSARFECPSCGNIIPVLQLDQKFKEPTRCGCGRKGKFRQLSKDLVDSMYLSVTPTLSEIITNGAQRNPMMAFLKCDLAAPQRVKTLQLGGRIRVVYVLKELPKILAQGGQSVRYDYLLQVLSFEVLDEKLTINFPRERIAQFRALAKKEEAIAEIAESAFYTHYGDSEIKMACLAALASGSLGEPRDQSEILHVLLLGDPSMDKTRGFLEPCVSLAVRGHHVMATKAGSSSAGLFVSAGAEDPLTHRKVSELGAIPRAHKGVVAVDEINQLSIEEQKSFNEVLEQQRITFDKSGLHDTAPCDVCVIAASNPRLGAFDEYSDANADVIGLDPSLVSRFPLVFMMRDKANRERDGNIFDKMFNVSATQKPGLDLPFIRDYLIYARTIPKPKLRLKELKILKEAFLGVRMSRSDSDVAIRYRHARAMGALTIAFARLRLASETNEEDAMLAKTVFGASLRSQNYDAKILEGYL